MARNSVSLVRGSARLAFDAVSGITGIVEAMHADISRLQMPWGENRSEKTSGITGLVYRGIGLANRGLQSGLDMALKPLAALAPEGTESAREEAAIAILNGVLGDHLEKTGNPLAQAMQLRVGHQTLALENSALAAQLPGATGKLAVLIHGLCMNDLQWTRDGASHADRLAGEHGYTPIHLLYNSGRHISTNGRELAALLETLAEQWPVPLEEISLVTHSMGGLVARSAIHYGADSAWLPKVRTLVFLGTPHHGSPVERGGNAFETYLGKLPFAAALSRLGMTRSAGVTDLRFGNLVDEDWQAFDRFERRADSRRIIPLPANVICYAAAATTAECEDDPAVLTDGLVRVASAMGDHAEAARALAIAPERRHVAYGMNHFGLLHHPGLHDRVARWVGAATGR